MSECGPEHDVAFVMFKAETFARSDRSAMTIFSPALKERIRTTYKDALETCTCAYSVDRDDAYHADELRAEKSSIGRGSSKE